MARTDPYETQVTLAAGVELEVIIPGSAWPSADSVFYKSLSTDEGKAAGASITDVRVKIIPEQHPSDMGGETFHTFGAVDRPNGSAQNAIPLGLTLNPKENIVLSVLSAAGGTIVLRVEREIITGA